MYSRQIGMPEFEALVNEYIGKLSREGLSAQWYVENFLPQIKRYTLELDMGNVVDAFSESHITDQDPIVNTATIWIKNAFISGASEFKGIPVHLTPEMAGKLLWYSVSHSVVNKPLCDSVSSCEESSYYAYLFGCNDKLAKITSLTPERVMSLAVSNPMSLINVSPELISKEVWNIALARNPHVIMRTPATMIDKGFLSALCRSENNVLQSIANRATKQPDDGIIEYLGLDFLADIASNQICGVQELASIFEDAQLADLVQISALIFNTTGVRGVGPLTIKQLLLKEDNPHDKAELIMSMNAEFLPLLINDRTIRIDEIPMSMATHQHPNAARVLGTIGLKHKVLTGGYDYDRESLFDSDDEIFP